VPNPNFRNVGIVVRGMRASKIGFPAKTYAVLSHKKRPSGYDKDDLWTSFAASGTYPLKPEGPVPPYNTSRHVGASLGWLNKDPQGRDLMSPNPKHPYVHVEHRPRVTGKQRISYLGLVDPGTGVIAVKPSKVRVRSKRHR